MHLSCSVVYAALALALCSVSGPAKAFLVGDDLPTLNITNGTLSVSGLSAGAFMAVQYHVAFSADVIGAGIVAGGPYYCAKGELATAETTCMNFPESINLESLYHDTQDFARRGKIDDPSNLKGDNVYLYSGTKDSVVKSDAMYKLKSYYQNYIKTGNISSEFSIESEHGMPTLDYGEKCSKLGSPYILKCNYDAAGIILKTIYGSDLKPPTSSVSSNIVKFDQKPFVPDGGHMGDDGYLYVPSTCQKGTSCKLHVVFHGCEQAPKNIGTEYVEHTGYNAWAEANNIVLLYPQCVADAMVGNPNACFDWWGYTNGDYATKQGKQMTAVQAMISKIIGKK